MKVFLRALLCLFLVSSLAAEQVDEKTVIERARATIGSNDALDRVVTLQLAGGLKPVGSDIPSASILIVARKPCSQRMELKVDDIVETTILHGRQGCIIRSNLNEGPSKMRDMIGPELERVRYSTRQFFNFYKPDYKNGETVSLEGIETRFGQRAYKLKYAYPEGMETIRYFSVENDSIVSTITQNGVESVGVGTQVVEGVKFPKSIEYYEGDRKLHTIVLDEILVNKPLEAGIFDIPEGEPSK